MKTTEEGTSVRRLRWVLVGAAVAVAIGTAGAAAREQAAAGQGYKLVGKWGKIGTGNGQFAPNAGGIDTDKAGNVYISDTDNHRVQVFTAAGKFLRKWGSNGDGNGQFIIAEDLDVAQDGTVWVAGQQNERLQAFSGSGAYQASIAGTVGELVRGIGVDEDGNVYAAVEGSAKGGYRRYVKSQSGWEAAGGLLAGGTYRADDVEASPDGTIFLATMNSQVPYNARIRHLTAEGKELGSFKRVDSFGTLGIAVDLDCNVWTAISTTEIAKYSPSGKQLTKATVPYIANDIGFGPKGDLYATIQNGGVVHLAEEKSKPATANVPGTIAVKGGKASVKYVASGFACPAQVDATFTLKGAGVSGAGKGKVAAGKANTLAMTVHGPAGKTVPATFTIVLKTNGRATTEKRSVKVSFAK